MNKKDTLKAGYLGVANLEKPENHPEGNHDIEEHSAADANYSRNLKCWLDHEPRSEPN